MKNRRLLAFAIPVALKKLDASGELVPPVEFQIFKAGINETHKGPVLFDKAAATKVMAVYEEMGHRVVIDYVHQAVSDPPVDAPAAGWMDLEVREGGLWATKVEWTEKASAQLKAKEYCFFSPTIGMEEAQDGDRLCMRPTTLLTVSLTNIPAMYGLEPLIASLSASDGRTLKLDSSPSFSEIAQSVSKALCARFDDCWPYISDIYDDSVVFEMDGRIFQITYSLEGSSAVLTGDAIEVRRTYEPVEGGVTMKTVLAALALSATATEAEALSATTKLTDFQREIFGLTGKTTIAEALGAMRGMKESAGQTEALSTKLKDIEIKALGAEVRSIVAAAMKGDDKGRVKITKGQQPWAEKYGIDNGIEALKSYLETAPTVVKLGQETQSPEGTGAGAPIGGKKWEDLKPIEKHDLFSVDKATYDALKADFDARHPTR